MRGSLESLGIVNAKVHYQLPVPKLVEMAVTRNEGMLAPNGALGVYTGKYNGRSPNDKFVVDTPAIHDQIDWKNNQPISPEKFDRLYDRIVAYLQKRDLFVFDGLCGADPEFRLPVRFINESAWQNLFAHQLFIRPTPEQLAVHEPKFTVIAAPGFNAIPAVDGTRSECFIILNFDKKMVIIGGTEYAGEIKKSIFTVMNYLMPIRGIASMHCSANVGENKDVAIFFGLSGTGKTSLSADPDRWIIGDDEHGWSDNGVFNYEGGCYAKCINLSKEHEPLIWNAIRFGAVLENVDMNMETRELDYDSDRLTENTRAAYPIDFIPKVELSGRGDHPKTVFFLTADAFGVMPPVSKLSPESLMYHFLSGYTSKLAGTERGITEPQATFSTAFGAPFLPLHPLRYAQLLSDRASRHGASCYLVNTGWTGGPYGVGKRISIRYTRAMVTAAINGDLDNVSYTIDPIFNVAVPDSCPNVPAEILKPRQLWTDKEAYDRTARMLAGRFAKNFASFEGMPESIIKAGPKA
jgi:phosphoenolpyruvate carboxykinase (ATP)